AYGPHGKPALREGNPLGLRFSLAHSGERALVAVGRERELGVDLERLREGVDHGAIAERFFPPDEAARLRRLPEGRRAAAFFAAWVCHEARLKAQGTGLFTAPLEPTPGF